MAIRGCLTRAERFPFGGFFVGHLARDFFGLDRPTIGARVLERLRDLA
jgi:hypothetical protein